MATVSDTKDFELQGSSITFNIGKSNYKRCHHHNYLEIFMILDGEVAHYHKGKKYILGKNAIAVIRPGEEHFFRKHKSAHLRFNISVTLDELKKITSALYPEFYSFLTSEGEPFFFYADDVMANDIYSTAHKLINMLNNRNTPFFNGLLHSLLCKTLSLSYEHSAVTESSYPGWLNDFIALLNDPEYIGLKVSDVANKSNYSYSHLCKLFYKYTGQTLLEYFKELKLVYAQRLLSVTDYSCKTISEMIGYQSSGHFVKVFSARFGQTPSDWRNNHRHPQ